mmetsp:Transcript_29771/g.47583  ORF Transcript_29771/g.47583 Transcript_29771/m.47583 type:complete len:180 (-) Transcript_29771:59-598(-)
MESERCAIRSRSRGCPSGTDRFCTPEFKRGRYGHKARRGSYHLKVLISCKISKFRVQGWSQLVLEPILELLGAWTTRLNLKFRSYFWSLDQRSLTLEFRLQASSNSGSHRVTSQRYVQLLALPVHAACLPIAVSLPSEKCSPAVLKNHSIAEVFQEIPIFTKSKTPSAPSNSPAEFRED